MKTITVKLGDRSYSIHMGQDILPRLGELLQKEGLRGKAAIVTNPTVAQLYLDTVYKALTMSGFQVTTAVVPDGEQYKNLESLRGIYDRLVRERFERNSFIVALGGGVIGDVAGFAAATYLRGIPYVQVPTTLLAQVDSSVGGKTGINHEEGKNLIGAFYQPRVVLIDVSVLSSLPKRELVGGMAEVIKYGIIEDSTLFRFLEQEMERLLDRDCETLIRIIASSCAIKARIVEKDERENDYRAVLNFGHTIGHALETVTGYTQLLHGEAVGIGMIKAAALSLQQGFCDRHSFERIRGLIRKAGLPSELPCGLSVESLIPAMETDKKSTDGKIKFVMCAGVGRTCFHFLSPAEILAALSGSVFVTAGEGNE